jgi:hypothetical protein
MPFQAKTIISDLARRYRVVRFNLIISEHQQSWGYEEGPLKGPGLLSAGDRYL